MIAKISTGKNFDNLMRYLTHDRDCINLGDNMGDLNFKEQLDIIKCVADQNRKLKNKVFHASLSIAPGESLTKHEWRKVGEQYLKSMGFDETPYVIVQHLDKSYQHIHLMASRVNYEGKTISDSNTYYRSMDTVRQLELDFNLLVVKTPSRSNSEARRTTKEIHAERRGHKLIKTKIKNAIDTAISNARGVSRKEFNQNFTKSFKQTGIQIQVHKHEGGEVYGMSFESNGIPFKSSKLGKKYQYTQLNKRLDLAFQMQRQHTINEKQKNSSNEIDRANRVNQTSQSKEIEKTNSPNKNKKLGIGM